MPTPEASAAGRGVVFYDYLLVNGGAERVSLELARALRADLCVGWRDPTLFPDDSLADVDLYDLQAGSRSRAWRYVKVTRAFARRRAPPGDYRWALYSGVCAPAAVRHRADTFALYYCHALPSFAYELREHYLRQLAPPLRPALRALAGWLRPRYRDALRRMDRIVANSQATRRLLLEQLAPGGDIDVIYPPVAVEAFRWSGQQGYYLSTARLEPHKRVDLIVDAFIELPQRRLVVAGWGSEGERLRRRAAGAANIEFTGWLDRAGMSRLVGGCIATVYFGLNEPFGISPVESLAAGKPVIAAASGALPETVLDGRTGILLPDPPDRQQLIDAVERLDGRAALALRDDCQQHARRFGTDRFIGQIADALPMNRAVVPPSRRPAAPVDRRNTVPDRELPMTEPLTLPPQSLRFMNEDDEKFRKIGGECLETLMQAGFDRYSSLIDLGSGYGRLAHAIASAMPFAGRYAGVDILPRHIRWCQQHIQTANPHFTFYLADIFNDRYNPRGQIPADRIRFDFASGSFDYASLFSVFTHMHWADIAHYLSEVHRLLKPGGHCVATFFLFDEPTLQRANARSAGLTLHHSLNDTTRYHNENDILHAIAFDKAFVLRALDDAGFDVRATIVGDWSGAPGGRYQDTLTLRRR